MNQKTLRISLFVLAIAMMAISLYMSLHYFEVKFPSGLTSSSLCDINQFFNCDKSISSELSNIAGVPISVFGFIVGLFLFAGLLYTNKNYVNTLSTVLLLNFVGCFGLFIYSLTVLKGLCPFCTAYYVLSTLAFFLYRRENRIFKLNIRPFAAMAVVTFVLGGGVKLYANSKAAPQETTTQNTDTINTAEQEAMRHYESLPRVQIPMTSEYKVSDHPNAPIKMKVFSDFECPACKALSVTIQMLKSHYQDKLDIEYFFFPLDMSCNPGMSHPLHPFACKAAYIAACSGKDFSRVHDELFQNQDKFSDAWLDSFAAKLGVTACMKKKQTKEKIVGYLKAADPVNLRYTPTFLVNDAKFEGALAFSQLSLVFDGILKKKATP